MTKIAIISQAEQGVLIDISGCSSLTEAKQYLTSTLQVSSQFWEGLIVDLNLGPLVLTPEQVNEIQAIVSEVGVQPRQIFSLSPITRSSLIQCRLPLGGLGQLQGYASMGPIDLREVEQEAAEPQTVVTPAPIYALAAELGAGEPGFTSSITGTAREPLNLSTGSYADAGSEHPADSEDVPVPDLVLAGQAINIVAEPAESPKGSFLPEACLVRSGLSMPNHHIAQRSGQSPAQQSVQITGQQSDQMPAPASGQPACPSQRTVHTPGQRSIRSATSAPGSPATSKQTLAPVLMMKQTLRSGQRVCHNGHLVIIGDVNPGAELVADGDITVWGALRGMAHAGASGNAEAEIRALKFGAIQLRIAQAIARSPDRNKPGSNAPAGPETARVIDGKIRLSVSDPE